LSDDRLMALTKTKVARLLDGAPGRASAGAELVAQWSSSMFLPWGRTMIQL
jgi:hypothetical protein